MAIKVTTNGDFCSCDFDESNQDDINPDDSCRDFGDGDYGQFDPLKFRLIAKEALLVGLYY